jgi:hypothetical protein
MLAGLIVATCFLAENRAWASIAVLAEIISLSVDIKQAEFPMSFLLCHRLRAKPRTLEY